MYSRKVPSPMHRFIGAIEGITIRIKCPGKNYYEREHYLRKEYFAINRMAMVDANYRFLLYSSKCGGTTQDSLVLELSKLGDCLRGRKLKFLVMDRWRRSFSFKQCVLTPFSRVDAEQEAFKDSFNYFNLHYNFMSNRILV